MFRLIVNTVLLTLLSVGLMAGQCSRKPAAAKKKTGSGTSTGIGYEPGGGGQQPGGQDPFASPSPNPGGQNPSVPTPTPSGGNVPPNNNTTPPGTTPSQPPGANNNKPDVNANITVKIGDDPADEIKWDGKSDVDATSKWEIKDLPVKKP